MQNKKFISINEINLIDRETLYVIGNVFDLMHGVPSRYYDFKEYLLRKEPSIIEVLENNWESKDFLSDFEENLGHFDLESMIDEQKIIRVIVAYRKLLTDQNGKDLIIDELLKALDRVCNDLYPYFEEWIKTLDVDINDNFLQKIFCDGKFLNFNYTEFIETIYKIPANSICYIHGCRKNVGEDSEEKLIYGHSPNCYDYHDYIDTIYNKIEFKISRFEASIEKQKNESEDEGIMNNLMDDVAILDTMLMKSCKANIKQHIKFFESLKDIKKIIFIGHSLSKVDWEYFEEIKKNVKKETQWYFGCYSENDVINVEILVDHLKLDKSQVYLFSTKIDF